MEVGCLEFLTLLKEKDEVQGRVYPLACLPIAGRIERLVRPANTCRGALGPSLEKRRFDHCVGVHDAYLLAASVLTYDGE